MHKPKYCKKSQRDILNQFNNNTGYRILANLEWNVPMCNITVTVMLEQ